jgi:hypothetical protein
MIEFESIPTGRHRIVKTGPIDQSRMSIRRETKRSYPVFIIYPGREIMDYFKSDKKVRFGFSKDRQWVLVARIRDGEKSYTIRRGRAMCPNVHVPIHLPYRVDKNYRGQTDCESQFVESEQGWMFRIINTIHLDEQLKAVVA